MKRRSSFCAALLSAAVFAGAVSPAVGIAAADGGTWKKSGALYWYQNPDGTWPANKWEKIGGKWYHFNSQGYMQSGWKKIDGNWYYLGSKNDGAMKTGWVNDGGTYYYMDGSGKMISGWKTISGKSYYFYADGSMAKNTTIDGYKIGADGAWIKENSTPSQEQKPDTPSNTALRSDYLDIFKTALKNHIAQNSANNSTEADYMTPSRIFNSLVPVVMESLDLTEQGAFYDAMQETISYEGSSPAMVFSDLFFQYLNAAGYDESAQIKKFESFIRDLLVNPKPYLEANYPIIALKYSGYRDSTIKVIGSRLIKEGLFTVSDFEKA